jgi:thiamine kinase-like enzyme
MPAGWEEKPAAAFTNTDNHIHISFPACAIVISLRYCQKMDELGTQALAAAVEVAARHGIFAATPRLLKDGSNAMIHLHPAPVVARVATTSAWIRTPNEAWLQRDLDIASYLLTQGAPVVPPSAELPPGPHRSSPSTGSMAMTFWTFVETVQDRPASDEEAAASLKALHHSLRGYRPLPDHPLPYLGVLFKELPHWLHWLEQHRALSGGDLLELREAQWNLANTLHGNRLPVQPLHGDAHSGNLLRSSNGMLWLDFEDACTGPVAWDVATLLSRKALRDAEAVDRVLAAYSEAPAWSDLQPFLEARELEAVIYYQVLARRFPTRTPEAASALATWQRKRNQ